MCFIGVSSSINACYTLPRHQFGTVLELGLGDWAKGSHSSSQIAMPLNRPILGEGENI
jgi:hypothetical protein